MFTLNQSTYETSYINGDRVSTSKRHCWTVYTHLLTSTAVYTNHSSKRPRCYIVKTDLFVSTHSNIITSYTVKTNFMLLRWRGKAWEI